MSNYIMNDGDPNPQEQELEQALSRALRRVDAPEGFAARMRSLAEAEQRTAAVVQTQAKSGPWWRLGWKPAWGAMAAMLVAGVLSVHVVHDHQEQRKTRAAQQASQQFDVSVEITDKALQHTREKLQRAGVSLDGE